MSQDSWQLWFEAIWAHREEHLYPTLFGPTGPGIYPIPAATFHSLGCPNPDPRFLTHGVFECPPTPARPHWLYVSSGMSNPWGDDPASLPADLSTRPSGLGCEFTLHAPAQARWPVKLLHWVMAVQLLVATGQIQGEFLQPNDRVPLGGALAKSDGLLTHLLVTTPDALGTPTTATPPDPLYPPAFTLASGTVELLLLIGITTRERDFAATQGPDALLTLLHHHQVFPLTNPGRVTLV